MHMALARFRRSLLTTAPVFFEGKAIKDSNSGYSFIIFKPHPAVDPQRIKDKIAQPKHVSPLSLLPPNFDKRYLQYPFLEDSQTFCYLKSKKSKVLFIMRGMPGSGKSTIVNLIKSSFDPTNLAICSADHFFTGVDGSYHFDAKLLGVAHSTCQQKAKEACENNTSVIVIDNTNLRRWEMKFYLNLCSIYGYITLLVQPNTPWSMNPAELANRNMHSVPLEALEKKVKSFEDVIPLYYGWFCDDHKSTRLLSLSSQLLGECMAAFPEFQQDLLAASGLKWQSTDDETALGIIQKYFTRNNKSSPLLHCTAKFCARGKVSGSSSYHQREDVRASYGRMFHILVSGLVFTHKTIGARVTLDADAAPLFSKPEEEEWAAPGNASGSSPNSSILRECSSSGSSSRKDKKAEVKGHKKAQKKNKKSRGGGEYDVNNDNEDTVKKRNSGGGDLDFDLSVNSLSDSLLSQLVLHSSSSKKVSTRTQSGNKETTSSLTPENFLPKLFPSVLFEGPARSAHLTLRTAPGVESKETSFDLLHTCDIEQELVRRGKPLTLVPVSHGQACHHGDGVCCVYFNKPIKLKTIFSGSY